VKLLNADLCRRRRQELGLSHRELARRIGGSGTIIDRLEAGANHADLTLSYLHALADALAIRLENLLAGDDTPKAGSDIEQLAGYLHDSGWAPKSAISELLDWTPARTEQAVAGLHAALACTGLTVQQRDGSIQLVPSIRPGDDDRRRATIRAHLRRAGMNASQARTLHRAIDGLEEQRIMSPEDRTSTGALRNAGYLTRDTRGQLTDDVRYSLLLDDT
jgi:transcriptional regulator with XRE-family HTH domain